MKKNLLFCIFIALILSLFCTCFAANQGVYIDDNDGNRASITDGGIKIYPINGSIDSSNSTTTTLSSSGVFTGDTVDITNCSIVFVSVATDVASTTNGLSIQQSSDGTNWDHTDDYTVSAGANKNYSINPHSKYFRVVYTNGNSAQGYFRLQTLCKYNNAKASSHRIKDDIVGDDDCELVKAALTGENGDGNWHNVKTNADGHLSVIDRSSGLSIAAGDVSDHSFVHKFGNAPDFDQGDGEVTIWDGAEDGTNWENMVYDYSVTANIDSISSSSGSDTIEIFVEGLDENYQTVTQTVTLNGQNRVALSTNLIRVFRAYNNNSTNLVGHVFVYVNGALTGGVPDDNDSIRIVIDPDNQQTEMAVYTVPAGYTAYLRSWYASTSGSNKTSNYKIKLFSRNFGKVFRLKHVSAISDSGNSYIQHKYVEPEIFSEKTDIEMRVEMTASGGTAASVSAGFDIVLVEN